MTSLRRSVLAAVVVPALLLAACSAAAPASHLPASSATPPAVAPPIGVAPPIRVGPSVDGVPPVASVPAGTVPDPGTTDGGSSGDGSGGGGGSAPGNPGDGTVTSPPANGGGALPVPPEPSIVTPVTGLTGIHPVNATLLLPAVNGRDVAVKIAWWSGVAPCSVLAGVDVARDGSTFTLTVREGAADQGVACIEIAMYKATIVDLGKLDPGTYTIKATGEAPAVQVTVA
jgi:hypothetical protein